VGAAGSWLEWKIRQFLGLIVIVDGDGPIFFVGGDFTMAGDIAAQHIATSNGTSSSTLGAGLNDLVRSCAVFDDGTGPALYAGGNCLFAGCTPARNFVRWGCGGELGVNGDIDFDCNVNGTDLLFLLCDWGKCAVPENCPADLNGDSLVDGADLRILLANWGKSAARQVNLVFGHDREAGIQWPHCVRSHVSPAAQ